MKTMRFKSAHVRMILSGIKTETRRTERPDLRPGESVEAWVDEPNSDLPCRFCGDERSDPIDNQMTCRWCKGSGVVPALPFAQLGIVAVYDQPVCEFSDKDAQAEGYGSSDELWSILDSIYGELRFGQVMHVVRFTLEDRLEPKSAKEAATAFERWRLQRGA